MKTAQFRKFEKEFLKREPQDIRKNLKILEGLYHEAVTMGVWPPRNPLEGLEADLRIARVINYVSKTS